MEKNLCDTCRCPETFKAIADSGKLIKEVKCWNHGGRIITDLCVVECSRHKPKEK